MSNFVIVTKIGFLPFALSLSKGHSWFDKLTTNGILHNLLSSFALLGTASKDHSLVLRVTNKQSQREEI